MNRNAALRLYIATMALAAVAIMVAATFAAAQIPQSKLLPWLIQGALFAGLCWIASLQRVYYGDTSSISMGTGPQIAAMIILPYPVAVIVVALGKVLSEASLLRTRKRPIRASIVNVAGIVLANAAAGAFFHLLRGQEFLWQPDAHSLLAIPALIALAGAYHVVDVLVVVGAISLSNNDSPWPIFRSTFGDMLAPQVSLGFVGVVFAVIWHFNMALTLLVVVPVWFSIRSFAAVARLRQETVEAVLKMAESIDVRDSGTGEHSKRLPDLTQRLATALGLVPEHTGEIVLASRVHDLGKIGISNDILLKQGPLTDEERHIMQEHPAIGANILASYSAFQSSAAIVRHHHERWDGKGYPDGLRGEEIPIGSRVISVVDAFDSMTSTRPYRQGMSAASAVSRLKDGMGSQFDPKVCAAFIQMLIEEGTYSPPEPAPELHLVRSDAAG